MVIFYVGRSISIMNNLLKTRIIAFFIVISCTLFAVGGGNVPSTIISKISCFRKTVVGVGSQLLQKTSAWWRQQSFMRKVIYGIIVVPTLIGIPQSLYRGVRTRFGGTSADAHMVDAERGTRQVVATWDSERGGWIDPRGVRLHSSDSTPASGRLLSSSGAAVSSANPARLLTHNLEICQRERHHGSMRLEKKQQAASLAPQTRPLETLFEEDDHSYEFQHDNF
jgi:hypothetical protein